MAEKTAMVPIGGREIEMRAPSEGALVVMARAFRGLPKVETAAELTDQQRDKLVKNLGILGQVIDEMVVASDAKDWLDDVMIDGTVTASDLFDAVRVAGEKLNGTGASAKPVATVRRRG